MSNGFSRAKGRRGELDVVHKLGGSARRTGHAFLPTPDITTDFAVYSVKNRTIGGATILDELKKLEAQAPSHHHYVVFKPRRGVWVVAELLTQHIGDHGEPDVREVRNEDRH